MSAIAIARVLMVFGLVLFLVGGGVYLLSRSGVNLFRLPGDIRIQTENVTCVIPIVTSILISVVLTVLLNVVFRLFNR